MHMTTVDKIKQARNVRDALLVLAEAIDELRDEPADEFEQPLEWDATIDLEAQLATTQDGDERRALEARLRLLKDDGGVPEVAPAGRPTQSIQIGDSITIDLPLPGPEQVQARVVWARNRALWEFIPLGENEAIEAFAEGGPMWLYLYDRDAVLSLPVEWRRELVEMIAEDSITESQEVGRDILKISDSSRPEVFGA